MTDERDTNTKDADVRAYWRYRKRTAVAFGLFGVAGLVAFVLRRPEAWGDGELASLAYGTSLFVAGVALISAFRSNGQMAECMGFCRGKYGKWPQHL